MTSCGVSGKRQLSGRKFRVALCGIPPTVVFYLAALAQIAQGSGPPCGSPGATNECSTSSSDDFSSWISSVQNTYAVGSESYVTGNVSGWRFSPPDLVVAQDGSGDFTTIQAAVDAVPDYNDWHPDSGERHVILIKPGVYREKVLVKTSKQYTTFLGTDPAKTIIVFNARASQTGPDGTPYGTFGSCSVCVDAKYFVAINVTFKNDSPAPNYSLDGGQGSAIRISNDFAAFYNCRFVGFQDTLCDHMGRHYFRSCYIEGTVDFVFGNGTSIYEECLLRALPTPAYTYASVTAHLRSGPQEASGFVFLRCNVTGHVNSSGNPSVLLGRAWGVYARVVFAYSFFDTSILPQGWDNWGEPARENTASFSQYLCWGPGLHAAQRVPWSSTLTRQQALPFLSYRFMAASAWLGPLPTARLLRYPLPPSAGFTESPSPVPKPPTVIAPGVKPPPLPQLQALPPGAPPPPPPHHSQPPPHASPPPRELASSPPPLVLPRPLSPPPAVSSTGKSPPASIAASPPPPPSPRPPSPLPPSPPPPSPPAPKAPVPPAGQTGGAQPPPRPAVPPPVASDAADVPPPPSNASSSVVLPPVASAPSTAASPPPPGGDFVGAPNSTSVVGSTPGSAATARQMASVPFVVLLGLALSALAGCS